MPDPVAVDETEVIKSVLAAKDYFEVLGFQNYFSDLKVPDSVSLRKAYISRSRICHPDKSRHPNATSAFQRLALAYETLNDDLRRNDYIQGLQSQNFTNTFFGNGGNGFNFAKSENNDFYYRQFNAKQQADIEKQKMQENFGGISLAEALGLFASVAIQLGDPDINRNFFDKAADALTVVDLYMRRRKAQGATGNPNNKSPRGPGNDPNTNKNSHPDDSLFGIDLQTLATGARVVGFAVGVIGLLASASSSGNKSSKRKS